MVVLVHSKVLAGTWYWVKYSTGPWPVLLLIWYLVIFGRSDYIVLVYGYMRRYEVIREGSVNVNKMWKTSASKIWKCGKRLWVNLGRFTGTRTVLDAYHWHWVDNRNLGI